MHYGDYAKEEDVEKVDFEKDDPNKKVVGYRKGDPERVDFEAILRSHGSSGKVREAGSSTDPQVIPLKEELCRPAARFVMSYLRRSFPRS